MSIVITVGNLIKINSINTGRFKKCVKITDAKLQIFQHTFYANTKDELNIKIIESKHKAKK